MRVPDCMIDCEPGVSLSPEQRGAIALALRHMTVAHEVADELRVIAPLHEGLSGAQVFQAELRFSSGQSRAVIVKLDAVQRLANELTAANLCATATNVARMLAPATADGFTHIVAIVYMHAAESWAGPLRTLEAIVRESLADRAALAASLRLLGRVLVALSSQVHKLDARKMSRLSERDYYIQRWLCNATVRVDRADRVNRRLYANTDHGAADPLPLELSSDQLGATLEKHVDLDLLPLELRGARCLGHVRGQGLVEIVGTPSLREELGRWSEAELRSARVSGILTDTGSLAYGRLLARADLDPRATHWRLAGHDFVNPLLNLHSRTRQWRAEQGDVDAVFSHGDLHGRNVLCIGDEYMFIDLGLAGSGQPRWVDAARLLGSLWRNAIAPQLELEGIAEALVSSFVSPGLTDHPAASFLCEAFAIALTSSGQATSATVRRELWIAVHHFCWIALKWSVAEDASGSEHRRRVWAMALLASIAITQVDAQLPAIRREHEARALTSVETATAIAIDGIRREHDHRDALTIKAELRSAIERIDGAQLEPLTERTQYFSAQLERVFMPDWGDRDIAEVESLALRYDRPLTGPEEVLLVDILLLGCHAWWSERAFGALLQLCDSGDEDVALEAYLAIYLLQARPEACQAFERNPKLRARMKRTLGRPEAHIVRRQIDRLAILRTEYDVVLFETIRARCGGQTIDLTWALRPFRAVEYVDHYTVDLLSRCTLTAMEESLSLSEIEKHVLARGLSSLPPGIVEQLFAVFLDESHELDSGGTSGSYRRLHVRIGTLMQLPHVLPRTGLDIEAASRQMSRTLADIVEDQAEFRHKVAFDLVHDDCRALQGLTALCDTPSDSDIWMHALVAAISKGDIQLFLDSLLMIPHADAPQQLRRDVEELSLALGDNPGSPDEAHCLFLATDCRALAKVVFAPTSLQMLLAALEVVSVEWEVDDLGNFAVFMKNVRGEMDVAQGLYERAIKADPRNARNLYNFALFMENVRGEMDAAQGLYERAIEADPLHANNLGNFARFMETVQGDMGAAQGLYERAIEADPHDANNLGNFAGFLFASGQYERGREVWRQARGLAVPDPLLLELEFYAYTHLPEERERALRAVEAMLEAGVRSPNFDLSRCVERARMDAHPEPERVAEFARRIAANP